MMRWKILLPMVVLLLVTQIITVHGQPEEGTVTVMLFMHNEDSALGPFDQLETREQYLLQRQGLVRFGNMIRDHGIDFCWQSDWKFLEGVFRYETEDLKASTNGKNLVRWLKEDIGMSIDPHSHEHYGYNYADVAHLIDSLGVTPTEVIGGHIYDPFSDKFQNWERFRTPLQGETYPWAQWTGSILMGSGTPDHTYDPAPSGIWRPRHAYDYWTHDPGGNIISVGQYTGDVAGVAELVGRYQSGEVDPENILTASIYVGQSFPPGAIQEYENTVVKPLVEMQSRGEIRIVDFVEAVEIWKTQYDERAHVINIPGARADTLTTRIPSESGGEDGLFAEICIPAEPRYGDTGAPILVHVPGGWDGAGLGTGKQEWPLEGFIEIRFNFPGSGRPDQRSGGTYDDRGESCIRAVRDVTRFALGTPADEHGNRLADYTGRHHPLYDNVGLVGWSNGGNATLTTAGAFGDALQGLAWIVNFESPVGDGMPNVEAGGGNSGVNPAYDPASGTWLMNLLAWDGTIEIHDTSDPNTVYNGGLYFEINRNSTFDPVEDFMLTPYLYQGQVFYSNRVRQEAATRGLLPASPPSHIPSVSETGTFWTYRNGEHWIADAVDANPDLMFLVEANQDDHVQNAPDHPHILIQYQGFIDAGARFVRLNPDRTYVEEVMDMAVPQAVDNDAFAAFDHQNIAQALEPNTIPLNMKMAASIAELADRTQYDNLEIQIGEIVTAIDSRVQPESHTVLANHPNPFNPSTTITFSVKSDGPVTLTLYDLRGRRIAVLVDDVRPQGRYNMALDVRDLDFRFLASGTYFLQLRTQTGVWNRKLLLLK